MQWFKRFFYSLVVFLWSVPAWAQDGSASDKSGLLYVGAGLAIGLGVLGGATGQGKASAAAFEGIARNPQSRDSVFVPFVLGMALIEFQAIMAFIIAFKMI